MSVGFLLSVTIKTRTKHNDAFFNKKHYKNRHFMRNGALTKKNLLVPSPG